MVIEDLRHASLEPLSWVLVFSRVPMQPWQRWLGTYKHVRAYAFHAVTNTWLFYDVGLRRTSLMIVPDGDAAVGILAVWQRDADMIRMRVRREPDARLWLRLGFWCVPAMKHLICLRSSALLPDTLWRDCLRAGGQRVGVPAVSTAATESGTAPIADRGGAAAR